MTDREIEILLSWFAQCNKPMTLEVKAHLTNTRETIPPHLRINEVLGYLEKRIDRVFKEELNR